jgi:hypothetical protein
MMLMNFETNYKYYFVHVCFNFIYFPLIFVLTTYSLKQDVAAQGQTHCEGISFFPESSSSGSIRTVLLRHMRP